MTDIYQKAYTSIYPSRLGDILLAADEIGLTGLWFFGQSYFADTLPAEQVAQETPILAQAREWLDEYFSGKEIMYFQDEKVYESKLSIKIRE